VGQITEKRTLNFRYLEPWQEVGQPLVNERLHVCKRNGIKFNLLREGKRSHAYEGLKPVKVREITLVAGSLVNDKKQRSSKHKAHQKDLDYPCNYDLHLDYPCNYDLPHAAKIPGPFTQKPPWH